MSKLKYKYQEDFPGFGVVNGLVSKPYSRKKGYIYSAIDKELHHFRGDVFSPTWDRTDHLQFVCDKCRTPVHILMVRWDPSYARPPNPKYALFFYMGCPGCGATGSRKIYLDIRPGACMFQRTLMDGDLLTYGDKEEPHHVQHGTFDYDTPVVKAEYREDFKGGLKFWCPWCKTYHLHGRGEGHRGAHCTEPNSPFEYTGYILKINPK